MTDEELKAIYLDNCEAVNAEFGEAFAIQIVAAIISTALPQHKGVAAGAAVVALALYVRELRTIETKV